MRLTALLAIGLTLSSCASMSNRSKTLLLMAGSAAVAGGIGAMLAPSTESEIAHGALWGGLAAAGSGAVGLFVFNEESKRRQAEARAAQLERELADFRNESDPELLGVNQLGLSKPLPEKYRNLVTPGQWSLYKVDRWTSSAENELVHQDMLFRFHQPQINPNAKPLTKEDK
jgi:hypothetical protein